MKLTTQKEVFFRTALVPTAQLANMFFSFHKRAYPEEMNIIARFAFHTEDSAKLQAVHIKLIEMKRLLAEAVKAQDAFSKLSNQRYALMPKYIPHETLVAQAEQEGRDWLELSRENREAEIKHRKAVQPQVDSIKKQEDVQYAMLEKFRSFIEALMSDIFNIIGYSPMTRHQWIREHTGVESVLTKDGKCLKWTTFVRHLGLAETMVEHGLTAIADERKAREKVKSKMGQYLAPALWEEVFGVPFVAGANKRESVLQKLKMLLSPAEMAEAAAAFRDPEFDVATV